MIEVLWAILFVLEFGLDGYYVAVQLVFRWLRVEITAQVKSGNSWIWKGRYPTGFT